MTTESSIEQSFVRWCKKHKITTYKLVLNPGSGWPDRVILFPGNLCCWMEFKTKTGRLEPIQEVLIKEMNNHGHKVYVVRSLAEAKKALVDFAQKNETALIPEDSSEAFD